MLQAQSACRGKASYVPMPVLFMLDHGRPAVATTQDLGLDVSSVYRLLGLAGYLAAEQPGYWSLLSSIQLACLSRELDQAHYTDCRAVAAWLAATYGITHTVSDLTDLLYRLGYPYKLTTAVPCLADTAKQTAFLTDTLVPLLAQAEVGKAVVFFADTAHPTHNTRVTHVWTEMGKERPPDYGQRPRTGQSECRPQRPPPRPGPSR